MIHVRGCHHVAIAVKDVNKSKPFYEGMLNLNSIPRPDFSFPGVWYQVGSQQLHLIQSDVVRNETQHFAIEVHDIQETFETLKARGVRIVSAPGKRPHDHSDYMFCLDPDGNFIELVHHE
jgi:catechol 2,3-dioxygenase-like lactoylglutathione lyase family enzyme